MPDNDPIGWRIVVGQMDEGGKFVHSVAIPRTCSCPEEALALSDLLRPLLPGYRLVMESVRPVRLAIQRDALARRRSEVFVNRREQQ